MDKLTFKEVDKRMPRFNEDVVGGFVAKELKNCEYYIERTIHCTATSFPPGLKYKGCMRCTPMETYQLLTAKRRNRQTFELARSDIYLMKYFFEYNGEELKPVYLFLPFVSKAGLIHIRDSMFAISPVLADHAISAGTTSIFIPVHRAKLNFYRLVHHYMMNGVREASYLVWSPIYNVSKKSNGRRKKVNAFTCNVHYLFCKYGFRQAFKECAGTEVHIGYADEINEQLYPADKWRICQSMQLKPRGVNNKLYTPTLVRIAIPNENWTPLVAALVTGFFYVADFFPERVLPEYVDETVLWKTLLGHIIFATEDSEGKILVKIEDHMRSLDNYIDGVAQEWLRNDNVYVNNLYDLLLHVVETFHDRITQSSTNIASLYDKRLTVLSYVLSDIIAGWFNMSFAFQRASKKLLTKKDVESIMGDTVRPDLVTRINRGHGEVSSVSSSTDNMIYKLTSNVVLQTSSNSGANAKKTKAIIEPSKFIHVSLAEVGSYMNLPKSEPSGRGRLNPCVKVGPDGAILKDPEKLELLDRVQQSFDR